MKSCFWKPVEEVLLERLWVEGEPIDEIAKTMERSCGSCKNKAHALGLPPRDAYAHRVRRNGPRWTEAERQQLREMWHAGAKPADIAKAIGRPVKGVFEQAKDLRLPRRAPPKGSGPVPHYLKPTNLKDDRGGFKQGFCARRASVWHLIDLKRAGHSPRQTELDIPPGDLPQTFASSFLASASFVGSTAAMCVEN